MGKINYTTDDINKKLRQIDELAGSNENLSNQINNFNSQLDNIEKQNVINAKRYGFIGDGKTLNDDIMKKFIENNSNDVLYFTKGVYLFSKTINFNNNMYIKCENNVELKLNSIDNIDYFITIRKDSTRSDYIHI